MNSKARNLQVRLAQRPAGMPGDETWEIREEALPEPAAGEFLVANRYISLDPAMRGWINEGRSYVDPVGVGEVMRAGAVGEVIRSDNAKFPVGWTE